jgi:LAGLIDADG DNA endonuclease family protein
MILHIFSCVSLFDLLFNVYDFLFDIFFVDYDAIILLSIVPITVKESAKLHNEYVVGLCDAEATFTISVTKDNRIRKSSRRSSDNFRVIYSVHPSFAVSLNNKDWHLINSLRSFFGVGKIKQDLNNKAITFYVNSVDDLFNVIIPFFKYNSLLSQKQADFLLFEKAISLIKEGAHLTPSGLTKIVSIKASMNKGLSDKLKAQFHNISLVERPVLANQGIRDGNWLAGFADGEGSFYVRIKKASSLKSINRISFFFSISQSVRDTDLMYNIYKYLNCGTISSNKKYLQFRVTKFEDVERKIIPFFINYPMYGIKNLNYLDFCKIMELVQSKVHLTTEGINKIKSIKEGMNFGRT